MKNFCNNTKIFFFVFLFELLFLPFEIKASIDPVSSWSLDTPLLYKISSHFSVYLDNVINVVSGSSITYSSHDDVLISSPRSSGEMENWGYSTYKYPKNVIWASGTGNSNYIYGLGGYEEYSIYSHYSNNLVYFKSNISSWNSGTSLPQRLSKGAATIVGNYIYFSGGWTDIESVATASKKVYFTQINSDGSLGNWNTTTDLPDVLWDHGMISYGNYIYVLAGKNSGGETTKVIRAAVNGDGTLGTWTDMPSLPSKTRAGGYTIAQNYIFVVGGYNGSNWTKNVYYTTLDTNGQMTAWQTSSNSLPVNWASGSLVSAGEFLYLIGGYIAGSGYTDYVFKTKLNISPIKPTVVFLPGMGASWNYEALVHDKAIDNEQWKIPGFIKNYDSLISSLSNSDLHIYAYDWRKPISTNADSLYNYLRSFESKVNLIGHSMGGLVAQRLAFAHPELVDKLITLGSPHYGAVSTYKIWEGADFSDFPAVLSLAAKLYIRENRDKFNNEVETLQNKVPSFANLLPTFDYLKNATGKPQNTFLPISYINNLYTIQGESSNTPEYYLLTPATTFEKLIKKWRYGKPVSTEYSNGDDTVLQSSGTMTGANQFSISQTTHAEIANKTQVQDKILEILGISGTTSNPQLPAYEKAILVTVASPVNFSLITPDSTVYSEDGLIVLNNPDNGNYSVQITPIGSGGNYTIYFGRVKGNDISWQQISSSISTGSNSHDFNVDFTKNNLGGNPILASQSRALEVINIIKGFSTNTNSKNLLLQDASRIYTGITDLGKQTNSTIYENKLVALYKQIDVLISKIANLKLNIETVNINYRLLKADLEIDKEDRFGN